MDALSSAVGLKVDFHMSLLVIASGLYRWVAKTMGGYAGAQPRMIFRDLIDTPATVVITDNQVQAKVLPQGRLIYSPPKSQSTRRMSSIKPRVPPSRGPPIRR
jgi:hypothetical protein